MLSRWCEWRRRRSAIREEQYQRALARLIAAYPDDDPDIVERLLFGGPVAMCGYWSSSVLGTTFGMGGVA